MISVFGTEIAAAQMRKLAKTTRCCSIVVAEIKLKMKKGIWSFLPFKTFLKWFWIKIGIKYINI